MATAKALTREEAKGITRGRLLDAAARLLGETGYGNLSASAVARAAGVAQPTFYVHFRDKDDLLRTLGEERIGALRARLRAARERVLKGEGIDAVRETFRVPLQAWTEQPGLLRLSLQEMQQPGSPIGTVARQLRDEVLRDLADDLVRFGVPASTPAEREQVEMMAESMIAQTEALALGVIEGRYAHLEAAVEILTRFAVGVLWMQHAS
jgi:AcrR family transcriptional regulator